MVNSFRMPVLDNGTTFPGLIPYALHTLSDLFCTRCWTSLLPKNAFSLPRGLSGALSVGVLNVESAV